MLMNRRLYRSRTDTILGGVAAGVADYLDADPALVRVAWAVLIPLTSGLAFIAYIVGWIVVPEAPAATAPLVGASSSQSAGAPGDGAEESAGPDGSAGAGADADADASGAAGAVSPSATSRRSGENRAGLWVGIGLILLGGWFLLRDYLPAIDGGFIWPLLIVGIGVLILVGAMRRTE